MLPSAYFRPLQLRRGAVVMAERRNRPWMDQASPGTSIAGPRAADPGAEGPLSKGPLSCSRSVGIVEPNVNGDISGLGVGASWPSSAQSPMAIRRQHNATAYGGPANQCRHRWRRVASIVTLFVRLGSTRVSSARMSHSGAVVAASVAKLCPSPHGQDGQDG